MNIVELCRLDDKKASYFVDMAKSQGFNVRKFRSHWVVLLYTQSCYRAEGTEFRSVPDGTYVFQNKKVYLVQ